MNLKRRKWKEKSYIMKTIKVLKSTKLRNLGKKPQRHTEKKTLKRLRSQFRKLLRHTEKQIVKKLSNYVRKPLQYAGKKILGRLKNRTKRRPTDTCKPIL